MASGPVVGRDSVGDCCWEFGCVVYCAKFTKLSDEVLALVDLPPLLRCRDGEIDDLVENEETLDVRPW